VDRPNNETLASQAMLGLISGLWVSQAVGTIAELGIPDHLAEGPRTADDLAIGTSSDADALYRLLRAAATIGVVREEPGTKRFSLTPLGEVLRSGVPGSMRAMAVAQTAPGHWLPWGRLRDAVRTGQRQAPAALGAEIWDYYRDNVEEGAAFAGAMHELALLVAGELTGACDTSRHCRVVDVGGSTGTLMASLLEADPRLTGVVFDLPHVAEVARNTLAKAGLVDRCEVVSGDFFAGVPPGDLYVLKQVLHDWDDERCVTILGHCRQAMMSDGKVIVIEMIVPDDGQPSPAQLLDLNMLVMLPGRERTVAEYALLFEGAGLRLDRRIGTRTPFQILEARAV
jgi:hypothetical protein